MPRTVNNRKSSESISTGRALTRGHHPVPTSYNFQPTNIGHPVSKLPGPLGQQIRLLSKSISAVSGGKSAGHAFRAMRSLITAICSAPISAWRWPTIFPEIGVKRFSFHPQTATCSLICSYMAKLLVSFSGDDHRQTNTHRPAELWLTGNSNHVVRHGGIL